MQRDTVKPYKLCRVCKVNYCESGYCADCRTIDATKATIAAREVMDKEAFKVLWLSNITDGLIDFINKYGDREINGIEFLRINEPKYEVENPRGFELISDGRKVIMQFR
jgi:hypothetical protein